MNYALMEESLVSTWKIYSELQEPNVQTIGNVFLISGSSPFSATIF